MMLDLAQAGSNARRALTAMVDCEDQDVRAWAQFAVTTPVAAKGQMVEPVTATLCLAGLILASRVKKIGPDGVEFYEGVPDGLAKVLKAAKNFFGMG
jgi:hypothetical protein